MAEKVSVGGCYPFGSSSEGKLIWPSFDIIITFSRNKITRTKSQGREASCHLSKPLSLPGALPTLFPVLLEHLERQVLLFPILQMSLAQECLALCPKS